MTPDELHALADRCEAAEGPDREMDAAIVLACGWSAAMHPRTGIIFWTAPDAATGRHAPEFTASLDAVMMLVPRGASVELNRVPAGDRGHLKCMDCNLGTPSGVEAYATGWSWPLAVCAAALRLRAAMMEAV